MSQDTPRPKYLTYNEVLAIHSTAIGNNDGSQDVSCCVRYEEGLYSALAQPKQHVFGKELYPTLFKKAAVYIFLITKNHPFVDGNKRTALLSSLIFLEKNGVFLELQKYEGYELVMQIARNQIEIPEIARFLESRQLSLSHPLSPK